MGEAAETKHLVEELLNRGSLPFICEDKCLAKPDKSTEQLQEYILVCCQSEKGGLRDKPERYDDVKAIIVGG